MTAGASRGMGRRRAASVCSSRWRASSSLTRATSTPTSCAPSSSINRVSELEEAVAFAKRKGLTEVELREMADDGLSGWPRQIRMIVAAEIALRSIGNYAPSYVGPGAPTVAAAGEQIDAPPSLGDAIVAARKAGRR